MPIVDDWKAIRDRMREIEADEAKKPSCPVCKDTGWTREFHGTRSLGHLTCFACRNPDDRPKPMLAIAEQLAMAFSF